jgi:UDP-sugar diphosphatase
MQLLIALILWLQPPQEITFSILHTNDEHSALIPAPLATPETALGGMARLATELSYWRDKKAQENEPIFVLSGGDISTGTPFNWLVFKGEAPELELMLDLKYDVITLGNHEFDYGPDVLVSYLTKAGYPAKAATTPLVSANMIIPEGHPLGDMGITPSHVAELPSGHKIGFIGLMGMSAADVAPYKDPITFAPLAETMRREIDRLKAEGVSIFIAVTHSGVEEDIQLAKDVPELHLIVGGHSHTLIPEPMRVNNTLIVQAGSLLQYLGILEIAFNPEKGTIRLLNEERGNPYVKKLSNEVESDVEMVEKVQGFEIALDGAIAEWTSGQVDDYRKILSETSFPIPSTPILQETPMGNVVTDAIRLGVQNAMTERVDFAFLANGVIRGDFPAGPIPFYDVVSYTGLGSGPDASPGYPLVSVYFTGTEVRRILEITILLSQLRGDTYYLQASGLTYEFDVDRAIWLRIPFVGTPIPASKAVSKAWRYTGEGVQGNFPEQFESLEWEDDRLYHVVTDYYNASFLPFVGTIVPNLQLEFKDKNGEPVQLDNRIVYRDGKPYKVWQAVAEFAIANPIIPASYQAEFQRQIPVNKLHMLFWPLLLFGIFTVSLIMWFVRKRKSVS